MWPGFLSKETCENWIELGQTAPKQAATTFRTGEDDDGENDGARKTDIRWLDSQQPFTEIHDVFLRLAMEANQHFGVSITNLPPIQFTEYAEVGHHYDFHHDVDWGRQDGLHRKISVVAQLSDPDEYEGGEFTFKHIENPDRELLRQQGTIMAFLPYHEHAVSPITSGSRTSLVGWLEGPRFR